MAERDLSGGLIHDLSNYLTALDYNLKQLTVSSTNEHFSASMHCVSSAITLLREYYGTEQTTSRIDNSYQAAKFYPFQAIQEISKIFNYQIKASGIELNLPEENTRLVKGRKYLFKRVVSNLVLNSIEAHSRWQQKSSKSRWIDVDIDGTQRNGLAITVTDNAGGIDCDADPFMSGVSTKLAEPTVNYGHSTEKPRGNGLHIVKSIVEAEFAGKVKGSNFRDGYRVDIRIPC